MIDNEQLSDDERTMICSCLIGYLCGTHHPRAVELVRSALKKLEGTDKIVRIHTATSGPTEAERWRSFLDQPTSSDDSPG